QRSPPSLHDALPISPGQGRGTPLVPGASPSGGGGAPPAPGDGRSSGPRLLILREGPGRQGAAEGPVLPQAQGVPGLDQEVDLPGPLVDPLPQHIPEDRKSVV